MLWLTLLRLKSKNPATRKVAAKQLGNVNDPRARKELLAALLHDRDSSVRAAVAEALGLIGSAQAAGAPGKMVETDPVTALITTLKDNNAAVRHAAARALGRIGDASAVRPLVEFLCDKRRFHKDRFEAVCEGLVNIGTIDTESVGPLLLEMTWEGQTVLEKIGPPAVDALVVALKHNDLRIVLGAAGVLGSIGDPRAVEALNDALNDERAQVRHSAAHALGFIGDARASESLRMVLRKDSDLKVRSWAAWALGKIGDIASAEAIAELLLEKSSELRERAARALKDLNWQPRTEMELAIFAVAQNDWDQAVKLGAQAIEPLVSVIRDGHPESKKEAADALVKIGNSAVEPLIKVLEEGEWSAQRSAAMALGKIGDSRAVEPLMEALKKEPNGLSARQIVTALGEIGDKRAVGALVASLDVADKDICNAAAVALEAMQRRGIDLHLKPETQVRKLIVRMENESIRLSLELVGKFLGHVLQGSVPADLDLMREIGVSLRKLGSPAVVQLRLLLSRFYSDSNLIYAAEEAIAVLGDLGDRDAVSDIVSTARETASLYETAREALRKIGGQAAVDLLR